MLEITGLKTVTIKRYIKSDSKKAGYIEVFDGPSLSVPGQYVSSPMYVHDPGSSKEDNPFGFHPFLETLIGWNLPEVQYKNGNYSKLYLQNIFPSFVIEQKGGWTDFLASIPYYALNDKETRAIEFVLNLDSADIQRRKTEIRQAKNNLEIEWACETHFDFLDEECRAHFKNALEFFTKLRKFHIPVFLGFFCLHCQDGNNLTGRKLLFGKGR